jgi:hypothetical protein
MTVKPVKPTNTKNPIVNISKNLPTEAVNEGYRLLSRRGGILGDESHYCAWLKYQGHTVCVFVHSPSLAEVKDEYLRHKQGVDHV